MTEGRDGEDLYALLGVPATADAAELARAYRRRLREIHPDTRHRSGAEPDDGPAELRAVQEAYLLLRDPARRARYDAQRRDSQRADAHRDDGSAEPGGRRRVADPTPRFRTFLRVHPSASGRREPWIRVGPVRIEPHRPPEGR